MASETDNSDNKLPDAVANGDGVQDEDNEAANDLINDAELAARQILIANDDPEDNSTLTPAEVDDDQAIAEDIPEPGGGDESGEI